MPGIILGITNIKKMNKDSDLKLLSLNTTVIIKTL